MSISAKAVSIDVGGGPVANLACKIPWLPGSNQSVDWACHTMLVYFQDPHADYSLLNAYFQDHPQKSDDQMVADCIANTGQWELYAQTKVDNYCGTEDIVKPFCDFVGGEYNCTVG